MPSKAPYLRNIIRRTLVAIVDGDLSKADKNAVWAFFGSTCVFCGREVTRGSNYAHLDHLIPASKGGSNHKSNRVVACGECNGNEKLDKDWIEFLRSKCMHDPVLFEDRVKRIRQWIEQCGPIPTHDPALIMEAAKRTDSILREIDSHIDALRMHRNNAKKNPRKA